MRTCNRLIAAVGLMVLTQWMSFTAAAVDLPDFTPLVEQNAPAVVNISTRTKNRPAGRVPGFGGGEMPDEIPEDNPMYDFLRRFFGDQLPDMPEGAEPSASLGSGFIVSSDGYVISNFHVVRNADEITVRLNDRREFSAVVVGSDERSDVALLKIDTDEKLPVLKLGKSSELKPGEWVVAIGSPFGFEYSVTAGIVSAIGRTLPRDNYVPFIQTDVAINPGNSGGPLFNLDGEVVGVNSQIFSRTGGFMGLSFAIPIDVVMNVYQQLRDKGAVTRGWLGVYIQEVTADLADSFGMDKPRGALVSQVMPDSPAQAAGFEAGDIVLEFDGFAVDKSSDLPLRVANTKVGSKVPVRVLRGGNQRTLQLTVGELPSEETLAGGGRSGGGQSTAEERLGLTVRDLTEEETAELDGDIDGVLVTRAREGAGFDGGIREGDVIMQVDNRKISGATQYREVLDGLKAGRAVPVLIYRRGNTQFLAVKIPE
ncbi:MAG: DegQ family serine endoprotease [Gammaproteobacteria bacterium]|nr:DegQ family serine endoprotease [Gammaproteobacteria bacterium]